MQPTTVIEMPNEPRSTMPRPTLSSSSPIDCKELRERRLAALMTASQGGDQAAYAELLRQVMPLLRRWIGLRIRQASEIEDIVQDTLLSLHLARATYDPSRRFLPWLSSIARNRMIDGIRRNVRRSALEVSVDQMPDVGEDLDPIGDYSDHEALRRAIKNLPKAQRQAVELVKLRDMALKEAAACCGSSIGALKTSVHRAIKTLRVSLETQAPTQGSAVPGQR